MHLKNKFPELNALNHPKIGAFGDMQNNASPFNLDSTESYLKMPLGNLVLKNDQNL